METVKADIHTDTQTQSSANNASGIDLRRLGFRALLGWHYCILFAPYFISMSGFEAHRLFFRQTILYIALACAFALFAFIVHKNVAKRKSQIATRPIIIFACVLGFVTTLLSVISFTWGFSFYLVVTVFLGFSEALLMFLWLLMFITLAKKQTYKILGIDVITGAVIATLTQALVFPASCIVIACLPLCSLFSFLTLKNKFDNFVLDEEKKANENDASVQSGVQTENSPQNTSFENAVSQSQKTKNSQAKSVQMAYMLRRNIPVALFALAFGVLQGSFLTDNISFLVATNPLLFLGIVVGGLIILFMKERFCTHEDANMLYRFSLVFFMFGVIVLIASNVSPNIFQTQSGNIIIFAASMAILAGFNLYDFGNMMICLGIVRSYSSKFSSLLILGRVLVYACMALGSIIGYLIVTYLSGNSAVDVLTITCCVTMLALVVTVSLISTNEQDFIKLLTVAGKGGQAEQNAMFSHINPCEHCGSVQGCRLHPMIARKLNEYDKNAFSGMPEAAIYAGNNADADDKELSAFQNIASDVSNASAINKGVNMNEDTLGTNSNADMQREDISLETEELIGGSQTPANSSFAASGVQQQAQDHLNSQNVTPATSQNLSATNQDSKNTHKPSTAPAEVKQKISPWRDACKEIIRRYRLSKREAEIFNLIAKGRNAEFVSQELVISIHTAKTHIANIYSKLDVHSSQEMLNLIDVFRAEIVQEAEEKEKERYA